VQQSSTEFGSMASVTASASGSPPRVTTVKAQSEHITSANLP
jgi:hypothetical protein